MSSKKVLGNLRRKFEVVVERLTTLNGRNCTKEQKVELPMYCMFPKRLLVGSPYKRKTFPTSDGGIPHTKPFPMKTKTARYSQQVSSDYARTLFSTYWFCLGIFLCTKKSIQISETAFRQAVQPQCAFTTLVRTWGSNQMCKTHSYVLCSILMYVCFRKATWGGMPNLFSPKNNEGSNNEIGIYLG